MPREALSHVDVLWVEGDVSVRSMVRQGNNVLPGDGLMAGDRVDLDQGDSVTLLTPTRHLITQNGPAEIDVDSLLESDLSANYPRLDRVWIRDSYRQWTKLRLSQHRRNSQMTLSIQSPRAMAIGTTRPWIKWGAPEPRVGVDLALELLKPDGTFQTVERWSNVRTRRFQFSNPFREGHFYRLLVKDGEEEDETRVYVLTREEKTALSEAESRLNRLFGSLDLPVPVRTMIMSRWLDDHGLFDRAAQWWAELAREHPNIRYFKRQVALHQDRELVSPDELLSLAGTARWLLDVLPVFLPAR